MGGAARGAVRDGELLQAAVANVAGGLTRRKARGARAGQAAAYGTGGGGRQCAPAAA